jgi:hypothetical protein
MSFLSGGVGLVVRAAQFEPLFCAVMVGSAEAS